MTKNESENLWKVVRLGLKVLIFKVEFIIKIIKIEKNKYISM